MVHKNEREFQGIIAEKTDGQTPKAIVMLERDFRKLSKLNYMVKYKRKNGIEFSL
jgi:hypothetical protein